MPHPVAFCTAEIQSPRQICADRERGARRRPMRHRGAGATAYLPGKYRPQSAHMLRAPSGSLLAKERINGLGSHS